MCVVSRHSESEKSGGIRQKREGNEMLRRLEHATSRCPNLMQLQPCMILALHLSLATSHRRIASLKVKINSRRARVAYGPDIIQVFFHAPV